MRNAIGGGAGVLTLVLQAGCPSNSPGSVARRFVDAYYVEFDLSKAQGLASGEARARVDQEAGLAAAARGSGAGAPGLSRVYYGDPVEHQVNDELVHFTFDLEIDSGGERIQRRAVVMLARRRDDWRVIKFREEQGGVASPQRRFGVQTSSGSL